MFFLRRDGREVVELCSLGIFFWKTSLVEQEGGLMGKYEMGLESGRGRERDEIDDERPRDERKSKREKQAAG